MVNSSVKWCRSQREILQEQLSVLNGQAPSPFNDFARPIIFADTNEAREIIRQWIDQLDGILAHEGHP